MTLTIEISDELADALRAKAKAEGLSADSYVGQVLEEKLAASSVPAEAARGPFKSSYGILAKYGPAPSAEDIDEVRREMWGNFPRDEPKD